MVRNRAFQLRLTVDEHETIKSIATQKGYKTLSKYFRHLAFQELAANQKISEIHTHLLGSRKAKKFKVNLALQPQHPT